MSWGDLGTVWPIESGTRFYLNFREIAYAIAERQLVTNSSAPSFNALIGIHVVVGLPSYYPPLIQNCINILIPKFVNHTIDDGNYHGKFSITMWDESSLLAELGETRLPIPDIGETINDWLDQQYRILNLLKWVRYENLSFTYEKLGVIDGGFRIGDGISWAIAYSNWLASSYINAVAIFGVYGLINSRGTYYYAGSTKGYGITSPPSYGRNVPSILDMYATAKRYNSSSDYNDCGSGYVEGQYVFVGSESVAKTGVNRVSDYSYTAPGEPVDPLGSSWLALGYRLSDSGFNNANFMVAKFEFTYLA